MDVQDIMDILDLHGFEDVEDDDKVAVINDVLQEIITREPWPYLEVVYDFDSADVGADGLVDFTSQPILAAVLDIVNTSQYGRTISWIRRDDHFKRNASQLDLTGTPYLFYLVAGALYLWPIPTGDSYRLTYIQVQDELTSSDGEEDILLPARHHRLIALGALYKLHSQEDDPENAAMFQQQFENRMQLMRQDLFRQQYDRPDTIQVVDEEDWVD
jgi:hypothetical protein